MRPLVSLCLLFTVFAHAFDIEDFIDGSGATLDVEDKDFDDAAEDHDQSDVNIDAYLDTLEGAVYTAISVDYGSRLAANGMPGQEITNFLWG